MLSLNEARRVIRAAEDKAIQLGRAVNIAVVDEGGNAVAHVRMDGAWLAGADMAAKKAYTARAFDTATSGLLENTRHGGELAGLNFSGDRRVSVAPGGIPLRRHGRIEGAIGVSGCAASEDETIALAGVRAFAEGYGEEEAGYNQSRDYPQSRDWERYGHTPSNVERLGNRGAAQPQHYRQSMQ